VSECALTSAFQSEGDGVFMVTTCVTHPEFRKYGTTWPVQSELIEWDAEHHRDVEANQAEHEEIGE